MTADEMLIKAGADELKKLMDAGAGVRVEMTPVEAFHLVAGLQLALRHPGVGATTREALEQIARFIEGKFRPYPAVAEMMRRGWQPEHDVFVGHGDFHRGGPTAGPKTGV